MPGGSSGHGWGMLNHPLKVTFIPWYHGMYLCGKFNFKLEFSMVRLVVRGRFKLGPSKWWLASYRL